MIFRHDQLKVVALFVLLLSLLCCCVIFSRCLSFKEFLHRTTTLLPMRREQVCTSDALSFLFSASKARDFGRLARYQTCGSCHWMGIQWLKQLKPRHWLKRAGLVQGLFKYFEGNVCRLIADNCGEDGGGISCSHSVSMSCFGHARCELRLADSRDCSLRGRLSDCSGGHTGRRCQETSRDQQFLLERSVSVT